MNAATITQVDYAIMDGVILLAAMCGTCGATVRHGGGYDPDDVTLGSRVGHCSPDHYGDLIDPNGVIDAALPDLRAAYEAHLRHAARRAARRQSAGDPR